jgi:uncharacterized membrane protein HdeD (DUF308 family)
MVTEEIRGAYRRTKWALTIRGLFSIAIGVLVLARPMASVAAFALVIALWALIDGIVRIAHSFDLRSIAPHWWVLLVSGLVSVAFGSAALYYYPGLSLSFAVVWTALWLMFVGVLGTYVAIQERSFGVSWGWTLTVGVLSIVAGVLALMYPGVTLAWLLGLVAAFAFIGGVVTLMAAWKLQSFEQKVGGALHNRSLA